MNFKNTFKKGKLAVAGVLVGGALVASEKTQMDSERVEVEKDKKTQRVVNKSDIRQKIAYLDEYAIAIESGQNWKTAYIDLVSKMTNGDVSQAMMLLNELNQCVDTKWKRSYTELASKITDGDVSQVVELLDKFRTIKEQEKLKQPKDYTGISVVGGGVGITFLLMYTAFLLQDRKNSKNLVKIKQAVKNH